MKIAVAVNEKEGTEDGVVLAGHFGRCARFEVFEVEGKDIVGRESRVNPHGADHGAAHAAGGHGQCSHGRGDGHGSNGHGHHHDHGSHGHAQGHKEMVDALRDCSAVLSRGMGRRVAEDLKAGGVTPVVTSGEMAPEQAVLSYVEGTLPQDGLFCRGHHS